ncbi:MAG: helix-turn-helix domain-containing protein [Chloroflexota bacterium]
MPVGSDLLPSGGAILGSVPALRRLRRLRGMTQQELAAAAGVHVDTIHDLERGAAREPRPTTMRRIAQALGVGIGDVDEFVVEREPPAPRAPARS